MYKAIRKLLAELQSTMVDIASSIIYSGSEHLIDGKVYYQLDPHQLPAFGYGYLGKTFVVINPAGIDLSSTPRSERATGFPVGWFNRSIKWVLHSVNGPTSVKLTFENVLTGVRSSQTVTAVDGYYKPAAVTSGVLIGIEQAAGGAPLVRGMKFDVYSTMPLPRYRVARWANAATMMPLPAVDGYVRANYVTVASQGGKKFNRIEFNSPYIGRRDVVGTRITPSYDDDGVPRVLRVTCLTYTGQTISTASPEVTPGEVVYVPALTDAYSVTIELVKAVDYESGVHSDDVDLDASFMIELGVIDSSRLEYMRLVTTREIAELDTLPQ